MLIAKEISVKELVSLYLEHAKAKNAELNAFIEFFDGAELELKISEAQKSIDSGHAHVLCGIPYGIKDNILYKGHIASAGSHMLENYTAAYSATVIEKLIMAGAICIGRTNMDDAAMGSSTESSYYGPTKNPLDTTKVPGGSSGGSAAAVAADMCLFALGTDTGGSVRQPASFCGVVGMYPTYGSTSRYGAIAMGSSLDQIAPMAKNTRDAQIVFETISRLDPMDVTSLTDEVRNHLSGNPLHDSREDGSAQKTRVRVIGVPRHLLNMEGINEEVKKNFEESLETLKNAGYEIRDIELPNAHLGLAVYYIVMPAEVSSNLSRYDGMKYGFRDTGKDLLETYLKTRRGGFGVEPRRRILLGTYVLSAGYYDAYYNKALKVRELIKQDFEKVFETVDCLVTPTSPTVAFKFGEKVDDPLTMYLSDIYTVSANIAGIPALSLPCGFAKAKDADIELPVGLQLMGKHFDETTSLRAAYNYEQSTNWRERKPQL